MKNPETKNKTVNTVLWYGVAILAITNILTTGYIYQGNKYREIDSVQYKLIDPSRRSVRQEDLIVNFQPLRDKINETYETNPHVSIYFEYLPTGSNISTNKDAEFFPASLLKVPVAVAVAKKIERGEWKWTNELVLLSGDRDKMFGSLYLEPTNSTYTIENLVRRSLIESDNTAHFILLRNLETEEIEDVYEHVGLKNFFDTDGRLSAKRFSVILRMLYTSSYLSPEYSEKLLDIMTESAFNDFIEGGLPLGVKFSHKIGIAVDKGVYVDSGIIYAGTRPYVLTVMVKSNDEEMVKETIKDISSTVYNYVSKYAEENI